MQSWASKMLTVSPYWSQHGGKDMTQTNELMVEVGFNIALLSVDGHDHFVVGLHTNSKLQLKQKHFCKSNLAAMYLDLRGLVPVFANVLQCYEAHSVMWQTFSCVQKLESSLDSQVFLLL